MIKVHERAILFKSSFFVPFVPYSFVQMVEVNHKNPGRFFTFKAQNSNCYQ